MKAKFQRLLTIAAAALLTAIAAPAQNFFFMQMSDPQFGMFANNANFTQETANYEFAIATVNRLHPAFAIVCGDLVNKAGSPEQIAEYFRISRKIDSSIPLHYVAGNHDVGNSPTEESLAAFRKNFGPDYYTFRHEDLTGIVLDSSLIQHPEKAPEEAAKQEQWLEGQLKDAAAAHVRWVVAFQHIPYFLKSADEPDQYFNIPRQTRDKYLALFNKYGVRYIFAGHLHQNATAEAGPLHMITTGAVGKPLGKAVSGLRIVSVTNGGLEDKFFGLGEMPNQYPEKGKGK